MSNAVKSFRHVQENGNRHLSLIHVIKQFVSEADSVEWNFLFPLCIWCMILLESTNELWVSCPFAYFRENRHKWNWSCVRGLLTVPWSKKWNDFYLLPGKWKTAQRKGIGNKTSYDGSNKRWAIFQNFGIYFIAFLGAFLDGKLARGDGLKHKQGSNVLTGTANRFTRINSLCASKVEIVFLGKIRGFQSCHFSHVN